MKKRKSALKYFIRLIKLEELVRRREEFHKEYAGKARANSDVKYDEDNETVEYEHMTHDFQFIQVVENFGQIICLEVAQKVKKSQAVIYDGLTSGSLVEQQSLYYQVMRDVEELVDIVAGQQVYTKYPCVSTALADIKKFAASHSPQQAETGLVDVLSPSDEHVVGCHYKYIEEGSRTEDKDLTRYYLGELFYRLRDELELISPDTSVEEFRAIFSGKVVQKPIVWIGTNKQLRHFFKSIERKLLPLKNRKTGKWGTVAACFTHRNGESFTADQLQNTRATENGVLRIDEIRELGNILR